MKHTLHRAEDNKEIGMNDKRSNYTLEEVRNIVYKLLLNKLFMPSAVREYENEALLTGKKVKKQ